ncbi:hypothetical protein D3C81_2091030 [compost metagenome]
MDRLLAAIHRVTRGAGDKVAGRIETAMAFTESPILLAIGRTGLEVAAGDFQVGEERQFSAWALNRD